MNVTLGLLAHVDAGKTTFAERLLYHSGSIRKAGRVDHRDTFLDSHEIERARGITVFPRKPVLNLGKRPFSFWIPRNMPTLFRKQNEG